MANLSGAKGKKWDTISLSRSERGLTARERPERFRLEAISELALRLAGGVMLASSILLWLILPLGAGSEQLVSQGLLATLSTTAGLIVYAYGTRGFRRQLSLDAKHRVLSLTKVNIKNQSRVARDLLMDEVESVFLRRASDRLGLSTLFVRIIGVHTPQIALTGSTAELEHVHRILCETLRNKQRMPMRSSGRCSKEMQGLSVP